METKSCGICGSANARAYRVTGLLLRHVCPSCFGSRCVHCGATCVDKEGKLAKGATMGSFNDLYCKKCSKRDIPQEVRHHLRRWE